MSRTDYVKTNTPRSWLIWWAAKRLTGYPKDQWATLCPSVVEEVAREGAETWRYYTKATDKALQRLDNDVMRRAEWRLVNGFLPSAVRGAMKNSPSEFQEIANIVHDRDVEIQRERLNFRCPTCNVDLARDAESNAHDWSMGIPDETIAFCPTCVKDVQFRLTWKHVLSSAQPTAGR